MEILEWFKREYHIIVENMKNSDHDYSLDAQSIHHMEGDVWTHTMMVYRFVQGESEELRLVALLHDIGKPDCRIEKHKKQRASFYDHQFLSSFLAVDILNKYERVFDTKIDKEMILKTINWHQELNRLGEFDEDGNFSLSDEDVRFINHKYSDFDFYVFAVAFAKADDYGRMSVTYKEIVKRMEMLENFVPEAMYFNDEIKSRQPHFIMLSGISCSGKSTWVSNFLKSTDKEYTVISLDDIIMENNRGLPYDMIWSEKKVQNGSKVLYQRLKESISNKENIILDMTNLQSEMRNRKVNLVPTKHYLKEAVVIISGQEQIQANNMKRKKEGKFIPWNVIEKQSKEFEYPSEIDFHKVNFIIN